MNSRNCLFVAICWFGLSCGDDSDGPDPNEIVELTIEGNTEVKAYLTIQLTSRVTLASGQTQISDQAQWSSRNTSIATVSNEGEVKGISAGSATITASTKGFKAEFSVTVLDNPVVSINLSSIPGDLVVSKTIDLTGTMELESGLILDDQDLITWSVITAGLLQQTGGSTVLAVDDGIATVQASVDGVSAQKTISISSYETIDIPNYMATPAEGHMYEVPVVILRYLPTHDGLNIDVTYDTDFFDLGEISIKDMIEKTDDLDEKIKFMLEEGSKFRGYKSTNAAPSLGYKVIEYINIYEPMPASTIPAGSDGATQYYLPDYFDMFDKYGIEDLVNNQGAKEIWIWSGTRAAEGWPSYDPAIHEGITPVGAWESNMSSPTSGDISNSPRNNNDMPVYNSSYVVYHQNTRRSQAEAIHNHGHQLEAILAHINLEQDGNTQLFWQDFVGRGPGGEPPISRAGDTHHPPNTITDYDYTNTTMIESDIEDWRPDNAGNKKMVNQNTWGQLNYNWPGTATLTQKTESQWYIYWMQNMPGHQNDIPYSSNQSMTNWWVFTGDWDRAINENIGLHD